MGNQLLSRFLSIIIMLYSLHFATMAQGQDVLSDDYQDYLRSLSFEQLVQETLGLNQQNQNLGTTVDDLQNQLDVLARVSSGDGGGWSGNGGEFHHDKSNIWFLSPTGEMKPISFCIERAEDFSFSEKEVESLVEQSIVDWKNFFNRYGMLEKHLGGDNTQPPSKRLQFKDGITRKINFQFEKIACGYDDKGEVKEIEGGLVFLFGKKNNTINQYQKNGGESQLAVALRQAYDHKSFKTTGFIWVENFTTSKEKFRHLLLHELGHVFGMKHDSVFVMDEDVAYLLTDSEKYSPDFFGSIESAAWFYRLEEGKRYVMTANRGKLQLKGANRGGAMAPVPGRLEKCRDESYMPNRALPEELLRIFKLRPEGCHQIVLSYVKDGMQPRKKRFSFEILGLKDAQNPQAQHLTLNGMFESSVIKPIDNNSPGLYTEWLVTTARGQTMDWLRGILDEKAVLDLPAKGKFNFAGVLGNRRPMAVRLSNIKGLLLEVFLPESDTWWVISNAHNSELAQ